MVEIALDPTTNSHLLFRLFENVDNVPELRKKIISGQLQCCLINPKLIVDPFQVTVAANKALTASNQTTKTIYTEILYNLSISKNITKSLQQFGVDDNTKEVLLVLVYKKDDDSFNALASKVIGTIMGSETELHNLYKIRDLDLIKKVYKIQDVESRTTNILDSVVSRIATKDFVSH